MTVKAYKTHKITANENLYKILDTYLPKLKENSVVAVTSKIVGLCEGRVVQQSSLKEKHQLAKQEADFYLPLEDDNNGFLLTINHNLMVVSAGIDQSNSNGYFSLWPKDPQKSTNTIREYLTKKHTIKNLGVILTDSKLSPMRWGVTGYAICHSGFKALNSYIGKPDIFGQLMHAEQSSVVDSLAAASVIEMGEGNEQQPLAVITDAKFVQFQKRNPTQEELIALKINPEDDVYASLLTAVKWKKGKENLL